MPIRPEERSRYPDNWREISLDVRRAAGWCCVWCGAADGLRHPETGSIVVLTVAHLDHTPENSDDRGNLAALCQRCHNSYDAAHRRAGIRSRRRAAMRDAGQMGLELTIDGRLDGGG